MPTPSLLIVPARFKTGRLYSQIPTANGDFTVTRNTTATRFTSAGLLESVASGIPRLDYYTSGGVTGCPALLVEPAATNGILNSADTTTSWTLGANLTSGAIDVIGVTGNNLTVAVSGSNISDAGGRLQRTNNNVALASGSTYTLSFFVKKTAAHTIGGYVAVIDSGGNKVLGGNFDVSGSFSSGITTTNAPVDNRIRRVEQWGTDVYRCSETFRMTASGTLTSLRIGPTESVTSTSNSAVGTQLGFAAPQIELGSVPTSFIPTTAGTGSRSADVVSVSGAVSGSIGQTEGTMYAEVDTRNAISRVASILQLRQDGSNQITLGITTAFGGTNTIAVRAQQAGSFVIGFHKTNNVAGIYKIAFAYKSTDCKLYINGTDTGVTIATNNAFTAFSFNEIQLGMSNSSNQFNDRIRAVALYNTRLIDAELATLTTP